MHNVHGIGFYVKTIVVKQIESMFGPFRLHLSSLFLSIDIFLCALFQFAVVYKARNNNEIIRDSVILWIAEAVNKGDTYKHKVDLSNPDLVILVEIIKASQLLCSCCMHVSLNMCYIFRL